MANPAEFQGSHALVAQTADLVRAAQAAFNSGEPGYYVVAQSGVVSRGPFPERADAELVATQLVKKQDRQGDHYDIAVRRSRQ